MRASELMRSAYLALSADESVGAALGRMSGGKQHAVLVVDSRDRYVGQFDKENCVRSRGDVGGMKLRTVLRKTSSLEESTDVARVAQLLLASDTHLLPVLDKYKRIAGVVGAREVLTALLDKLRGLRVKDVASAYPVVLCEEESVAKAVDIVRRKKVSRIPVVDARRRLAGIVTRFDLLVGFVAKPVPGYGGAKGGWRQATSVPRATPPKAANVCVANLMRKSVETVAPGLMVQAAVRKMLDANVSDLVVVEDGVPVGMLSTRDLLKIVAK